MSSHTASSSSTARRPLLGLRRTPGRLALTVFRAPLWAYRHDLGWLLGHTFLLLVHQGRRTGKPHEMVAMVLQYDPRTQEAVICSAWGSDADWVRNLRAHPGIQVQLGRQSFKPEHRFLSEDESVQVVTRFSDNHPWRLRLISALLGWGDLESASRATVFARNHPFVAFRPMP